MHRSRPIHDGKLRPAGVPVTPRTPFGRGPSTRVVREVLAGLVVGFAILLMTGSPASAHAELEASNPRSGEILTEAPTAITLTFGEGVEFTANAIQVFDDHRRRVRTGPVGAVNKDGSQLRATLPSGLSRGSYTVSWSVSSDDTHPVSGSFGFSIGAPSAVTGPVPGQARNDAAGLMLGIARGAGYLGLALGPGLLLVVCLLWRPGLQDRSTRRLLYAGVTLLALSTLGEMLFEGVWASGRPFSAIWSSPGSLDTGSRRFDQLHALRLYLLVAFGAALVAALTGSASTPSARSSDATVTGGSSPDAQGGRGTAPLAASTGSSRGRTLVLAAVWVSSAALLATWAFAGHAAVGDATPLALVANLAHLSALTLWLGGLVLLAVVLRPPDRAGALARVLPRFSRLAFACVATLVATGTFMAWREVGSVDALTSTEYGRVLLAKLVGVVALVAVGNMARRWVQRHLPPPPRRRMPLGVAGIVPSTVMTFRPVAYGPPEVRRLRRGIIAELVIAALVLGLATALVVIVPARQAYVRPFHRVLRASGVTVVVDLPSPRMGDAVLHVAVTTADGRPQPVTGLSGSISLVSHRIGPLPLGAAPAGQRGHQGVRILR